MEIIEQAIQRQATTLSETASKQVLAAYGIPVVHEFSVTSMQAAVEKAEEIGYPVVLKACGEAVLHKTESDWVFLDVSDRRRLKTAYRELMSRSDGRFHEVLVQPMIKGHRELMIGLKQDPQFGPCVVFGLGGVLTEVLEDIAVRVAPIGRSQAMDMLDDIQAKKILNAFRGEPPADRKALARMLSAVGQIGQEHPEILEIDINPVKLVNGKPLAVDALIILKAGHGTPGQ